MGRRRDAGLDRCGQLRGARQRHAPQRRRAGVPVEDLWRVCRLSVHVVRRVGAQARIGRHHRDHIRRVHGPGRGRRRRRRCERVGQQGRRARRHARGAADQLPFDQARDKGRRPVHHLQVRGPARRHHHRRRCRRHGFLVEGPGQPGLEDQGLVRQHKHQRVGMGGGAVRWTLGL